MNNINFESMEDRYEDIFNKPVSEVMSTTLTTAGPDTPILKVASLMILKKIRRVPIVEGDKVVGIVTQGDIHQAIFKKECTIA
ncbi:MAG: CBS domain-containing protein, partial [Nitrospinota bacterium]